MLYSVLTGLTLALSVLAQSTESSSSSSSSSSCKNPTVRKEWRSFTTAQKTAWVNAVNCLANKPHNHALVPTVNPSDIPPMNTSSSLYDDFVYLHMDVNHNVHYTGLFLPFHRWFLHTFEQTLASECGYTGPMGYWDWTKDTANPIGTTMLSSSTTSGLGTSGSAYDDFTVHDGAFGSNLGKFSLSYPVPHYLRRNLTNTPWPRFPAPFLITGPMMLDVANVTNTNYVNTLINSNVGDFVGFQTYLDRIQGMHSGPHLMFGADLQGTCPASAPTSCISGQAWSPNDPMFFLHHGMLDRVWAEWQAANPKNAVSYGGGTVQSLSSLDIFSEYPVGAPPSVSTSSVIPNDGLGTRATVSEVMSTTGGFLCYVYE